MPSLKSVKHWLPVLRAQAVNTFRGFKTWRTFSDWNWKGSPGQTATNPLREYFVEHKEGRGIWKFNHYFDAYEKHFRRFRGSEVHVLEIGVFSGGSLEMWRDYFGPVSRIYGVDVEPSCNAYESDRIRIFTGDQSDRIFWRGVKQQVPNLDIVIDDGSHISEHQIITLEELLPHLRPGGVYLCEDISHTFSGFAAYVYGMGQHLNEGTVEHDLQNPERRQVIRANSFQAAVGSVHSYPLLTVIERTQQPITELIAPQHGTRWAPFLK